MIGPNGPPFSDDAKARAFETGLREALRRNTGLIFQTLTASDDPSKVVYACSYPPGDVTGFGVVAWAREHSISLSGAGSFLTPDEVKAAAADLNVTP